VDKAAAVMAVQETQHHQFQTDKNHLMLQAVLLIEAAAEAVTVKIT